VQDRICRSARRRDEISRGLAAGGGGAANDMLCAYPAKCFGLSKKAVTAQSGQSSRKKRLLLMGVPASCVRDALMIG